MDDLQPNAESTNGSTPVEDEPVAAAGVTPQPRRARRRAGGDSAAAVAAPDEQPAASSDAATEGAETVDTQLASAPSETAEGEPAAQGEEPAGQADESAAQSAEPDGAGEGAASPTPPAAPLLPPVIAPPRLVWPPRRRGKAESNGAPAPTAGTEARTAAPATPAVEPVAPPPPQTAPAQPQTAPAPRGETRGAVLTLPQQRTQSRSVERPASQSQSTWNKEPVIELIDVHKAFGSLKVLDGVTCRIPRGEITVLMGPSGTGKSVTLRHIVGLLPPDRGDVYVDGMPVHKLNERELLDLRRGIGMLFQDGALFSSMNLYDNVAFPLRQHTKKSEDEVREIVMEHLMEVGLAGADKRMPNELSGGMRKRAGFARALVMEPKILLFDEPDSGLDPVRTTLLCDLIREISQKYNATSIVVSHDVGAVRRFADNIGILYKGKMRHFGSKQEIEESDDEFVHQFFNASSEGPLGMD